jgi:hypothetical protein
MLCSKSAYFARCLKGKFSEATKKVVQLNDWTDIGTFKHFVQFVETGHIRPFHTFLVTFREDVDQMVKVWVLRDRLLCPVLQNQAMQVIQRVAMAGILDFESIIHAIEISPPDSVLFQYLAKQVSHDHRAGCLCLGNGNDNREAWLALIAVDAEFTFSIIKFLGTIRDSDQDPACEDWSVPVDEEDVDDDSSTEEASGIDNDEDGPSVMDLDD